jgi:hypothetical protein
MATLAEARRNREHANRVLRAAEAAARDARVRMDNLSGARDDWRALTDTAHLVEYRTSDAWNEAAQEYREAQVELERARAAARAADKMVAVLDKTYRGGKKRGEAPWQTELRRRAALRDAQTTVTPSRRPKKNPPHGYIDAGDPDQFGNALVRLWLADRDDEPASQLLARVEDLLVAQDAYVADGGKPQVAPSSWEQALNGEDEILTRALLHHELRAFDGALVQLLRKLDNRIAMARARPHDELLNLITLYRISPRYSEALLGRFDPTVLTEEGMQEYFYSSLTFELDHEEIGEIPDVSDWDNPRDAFAAFMSENTRVFSDVRQSNIDLFVALTQEEWRESRDNAPLLFHKREPDVAPIPGVLYDGIGWFDAGNEAQLHLSAHVQLSVVEYSVLDAVLGHA